MTKGSNRALIAVSLVAILVLAGIVLLSQPQQVTLPTPPAVPGAPAAVAPGETPAATAQPAVSRAVNTGELELFLKSSTGTTGSSSVVLLLDKSQWKGNEADTKYALMQTRYEKGLEGLTAFGGGTPKEIAVASGEWSDTSVSGSVGDQLVVFTYVDTSPAATENASTARLVTLKDFYRETGKWVAQTSEGASNWKLDNYADYDWFDGTDTERNGYVYGDGASVDNNQIISWYTRSNTIGEKLVDGVVYVTAPSNFTAKFKSLTVTDKSGHSKKFSTLAKAENFASDDYRSVAATVISAAPTNTYIYYLGDIPADFNTLYTSGDKNRLTWELEVDTYGTTDGVNLYFNIVQGGKAKVSNNGPFVITDDFQLLLNGSSTSWWGYP